MYLNLLDTNFTQLAVVDFFESLIWTEKYSEPGDFEILTAVDLGIIDRLRENRYLYLRGSDKIMVIEEINIKTNTRSGNKILVKGRSIESILDRRIVWGQVNLSDSLQNGIQTLLINNVIDPTVPERTIPNFIFEPSTDPAILGLNLEAQYFGDNLLTVITDICKSKKIGFKITLDDLGRFVFKLYTGTDRSYDQTAVPYVTFSPKFENILNSEYSSTIVGTSTYALVGGEGTGAERLCAAVDIMAQLDGSDPPGPSTSGLALREMFVDGTGTSRTISGGELSLDQYIFILKQKGLLALYSSQFTTKFEGQVEAAKMYMYGKDFFMGDIVQVSNEYGHKAKSRVIELTRCQDKSGERIYPTFSTL